MKKIRVHFKDKDFFSLFVSGVLLLFLSLVINYIASIYATESASNSVTDIILSNTRAYDVDGIFVFGPMLMWTFVAFQCLREPKRIPFVLKSIAVFVCIRSIFVSLTHIGPFPTAISVDSNMLKAFSIGGDLFFSGHTGLPFLMALIFWNQFRLRVFFLITSVIFGIVVLLGHLHYTIDVLSAFFITYTIFHIAKFLFKKECLLFSEGLQEEVKKK